MSGLLAAGRFLRDYGIPAGKALPTLFDNLLTGRFNRVPRRGPAYVNLAVSDRCNLRCRLCGRWELPPAQNAENLTLDEWRTVLDQLAAAGTCQVSFYDREPLLLAALPELVRHAKTRGLAVNVTTNGYLLVRRGEELVAAGVDSILVSADSHRPEVHDRLRGTPGSFAALADGIARLNQARGAARRPRLGLRVLISRANVDELVPLVEYWRPRIDELMLKPANDNPEIGYRLPAEAILNVADRPRVEKLMASLRARFPELDDSYHRQLPAMLSEPEMLRNRYRCYAGSLFGTVALNGDIFPCAERHHRLGNVRTQPFLAVWRSAAARAVRSRRGADRDCHCWLEMFRFNTLLTGLMGRGR